MKDYLNTQERENFVRLTHYASDLQRTIECNALTSREKGDLKRAFTYTFKTLESVVNRINEDSRKAYQRSAKNSRTILDNYGDMEINQKFKSANIEDTYEKNKEYYALVEIIFSTCCYNCKNNGATCEIYKEFENQNIPEFDGTDKCTNCKYSWGAITK